MFRKKKDIQLAINLFPFLGITLFLLLFIYSATLYPGGSQADINSIGFDWINNYWCNLLNEKGMNGALNLARPYAITAMVILCLSLMVFFIQFAEAYSTNMWIRKMIQVAGILSMSFAILVFTKKHDLMTNLSSFFGLFVVLGIIREIYNSELTGYKASGLCCIILLGLNNYIYYSEHLLEWLPILQKVSFLIVLSWVIGLNFELRKELETY